MSSFVSGTTVRTSVGRVPIEQLEIPQPILTLNGWKLVDKVGTEFSDKVMRIHCIDGPALAADSRANVLSFSRGDLLSFTSVKNLAHGDLIFTVPEHFSLKAAIRHFFFGSTQLDIVNDEVRFNALSIYELGLLSSLLNSKPHVRVVERVEVLPPQPVHRLVMYGGADSVLLNGIVTCSAGC